MIRSSRLAAGVAGLFLAACLGVTAQEPPKKDGPPQKEGEKGKGGFGRGKEGNPGGGFGRFERPKPGTVLTSATQDQLKMTAEQKKEIADLQKMVDEKLAKILTEAQAKQLKEMGERGPGFGGRGGPGGGGAFPPKKDN